MNEYLGINRKLSKLRRLLIITGMIFPLVIICFYLFGIFYSTDKNIYEINWHIKIPIDLKEIYSVKTPSDFHGDGYRMTVYKIKKSADVERFMKGFNTNNGEIVRSEITVILSNLNVDSRFKLDYEGKYLWKRYEKLDGSYLLMIFDIENPKIYILQCMM